MTNMQTVAETRRRSLGKLKRLGLLIPAGESKSILGQRLDTLRQQIDLAGQGALAKSLMTIINLTNVAATRADSLISSSRTLLDSIAIPQAEIARRATSQYIAGSQALPDEVADAWRIACEVAITIFEGTASSNLETVTDLVNQKVPKLPEAQRDAIAIAIGSIFETRNFYFDFIPLILIGVECAIILRGILYRIILSNHREGGKRQLYTGLKHVLTAVATDALGTFVPFLGTLSTLLSELAQTEKDFDIPNAAKVFDYYARSEEHLRTWSQAATKWEQIMDENRQSLFRGIDGN